MLCHFFWFQFLASAGPKNGRIQKNGWQNFSTIIVLVWGQSWKKVVYIAMAKNLIFHFLSKTPILTKNGSPAPQGGAEEKIISIYQEVVQ